MLNVFAASCKAALIQLTNRLAGNMHDLGVLAAMQNRELQRAEFSNLEAEGPMIKFTYTEADCADGVTDVSACDDRTASPARVKTKETLPVAMRRVHGEKFSFSFSTWRAACNEAGLNLRADAVDAARAKIVHEIAERLKKTAEAENAGLVRQLIALSGSPVSGAAPWGVSSTTGIAYHNPNIFALSAQGDVIVNPYFDQDEITIANEAGVRLDASVIFGANLFDALQRHQLVANPNYNGSVLPYSNVLGASGVNVVRDTIVDRVTRFASQDGLIAGIRVHLDRLLYARRTSTGRRGLQTPEAIFAELERFVMPSTTSDSATEFDKGYLPISMPIISWDGTVRTVNYDMHIYGSRCAEKGEINVQFSWEEFLELMPAGACLDNRFTGVTVYGTPRPGIVNTITPVTPKAPTPALCVGNQLNLACGTAIKSGDRLTITYTSVSGATVVGYYDVPFDMVVSNLSQWTALLNAMIATVPNAGNFAMSEGGGTITYYEGGLINSMASGNDFRVDALSGCLEIIKIKLEPCPPVVAKGAKAKLVHSAPVRAETIEGVIPAGSILVTTVDDKLTIARLEVDGVLVKPSNYELKDGAVYLKKAADTDRDFIVTF